MQLTRSQPGRVDSTAKRMSVGRPSELCEIRSDEAAPALVDAHGAEVTRAPAARARSARRRSRAARRSIARSRRRGDRRGSPSGRRPSRPDLQADRAGRAGAGEHLARLDLAATVMTARRRPSEARFSDARWRSSTPVTSALGVGDLDDLRCRGEGDAPRRLRPSRPSGRATVDAARDVGARTQHDARIAPRLQQRCLSARELCAGGGDRVHVARAPGPTAAQRIAVVARDDVHVEVKDRLPGGGAGGVQEVDARPRRGCLAPRGEALGDDRDGLQIVGRRSRGRRWRARAG